MGIPRGFGITTGKTATTVLEGDGFYPDLAVAEFMELYRLPAEYAETLIADHLDLARFWAAGELVAWREKQQASGHTALDQISVHGVQGGALRLYKRAVFCRAKALLLPQFATIERREPARNDAKEAPESAQAFFAQAANALAAIIGRTFISVEAI